MATKNIERQWALKGLAPLTPANIGAGNEVTFRVPPGALLLGVQVFVETAFNSATTTTLTVGDGTTTFVSAVDAQAAGNKAATGVPKYYPTGGTITVSMAETGAAATAGLAFVVPDYVIVDRANEVAE